MYETKYLPERVRTLERHVGWLKRANCIVVLAFGTAFIMGQVTARDPNAKPQTEVRAKRFVLVDDDGDCRAALGFSPGVLVHGRSKPGFESAVLNLYAKSTPNRLTLMVTHNGMPAIMFFGKDGKPSITARLLPDDSPAIWFFDNEERERLKMFLDPDWTPRVVLKDKDGNETIFTP